MTLARVQVLVLPEVALSPPPRAPKAIFRRSLAANYLQTGHGPRRGSLPHGLDSRDARTQRVACCVAWP